MFCTLFLCCAIRRRQAAFRTASSSSIFAFSSFICTCFLLMDEAAERAAASALATAAWRETVVVAWLALLLVLWDKAMDLRSCSSDIFVFAVFICVLARDAPRSLIESSSVTYADVFALINSVVSSSRYLLWQKQADLNSLSFILISSSESSARSSSCGSFCAASHAVSSFVPAILSLMQLWFSRLVHGVAYSCWT